MTGKHKKNEEAPVLELALKKPDGGADKPGPKRERRPTGGNNRRKRHHSEKQGFFILLQL